MRCYLMKICLNTYMLFRLLSLYHTLHASVHAKMAHLKVQHCVSRDLISLAWITPLFELYCVAGPNSNRNALAQSANRVVQWVRKEEERVFIIGGTVSHRTFLYGRITSKPLTDMIGFLERDRQALVIQDSMFRIRHRYHTLRLLRLP